MPRRVEARGRLPRCRNMLPRVNAMQLLQVLADLPPMGTLNIRPGKISLSYKHNPHALIGGRSETVLTVYKSVRELRVEGRGKLIVNLRIRCSGDEEATVSLEVGGEHEPLVPEEKLEYALKRLVKVLAGYGFQPTPTPPPQPPAAQAQPPQLPASLQAVATQPAPPPQQPPAPAALPAAPSLVAAPPQPPAAAALESIPAAALAADERLRRLQCAARLVTAGFPVDPELSRRVPIEYSPRLRTGTLVDSGSGSPDSISLVHFDDADYLIRIAVGDYKADIARLASRGLVGVYLRGPGVEAYGEEALEKLLDLLCRPGARMLYWVVRL